MLYGLFYLPSLANYVRELYILAMGTVGCCWLYKKLRFESDIFVGNRTRNTLLQQYELSGKKTVFMICQRLQDSYFKPFFVWNSCYFEDNPFPGVELRMRYKNPITFVCVNALHVSLIVTNPFKHRCLYYDLIQIQLINVYNFCYFISFVFQTIIKC